MSILPLVGHHDLRRRIDHAVVAGDLPQVLLLTGPRGVGKQRLALWVAQRLLCQSPTAGEPCGSCSSCLRTLGLAHPDLHWIVPVPRPKAADHDKQVEETAESIEAVLAERRTNPLWAHPDGMASHGISAARLIQRRATLTAAEGGARVFIIGQADRLVPQESSQEGANALLKLLEEPPARTWFLLTTTTPGQVLTTIRSRAIPIRLQRLADDDVTRFFREHHPTGGEQLDLAAAHGSIGRALAGDGADRKAAEAAEAWRAALAKGVTAATERALKQGPWQARGDFSLLLDALADQLMADGRTATRRGDLTAAAARTAAVEAVLQARERAQGNVNPQLLLATLGDRLTALGAAS